MTPQEAAYVLRLQRRASELQPDLARRLLQAYEQIRKVLRPAELERAIADGLVDGLINEVLSDVPRGAGDPFASLRQLIDRSLLDAAVRASNDLSQRFAVTFDTLNPRVIEAARSLDSQAINTLRADVRESVRATVIDGLKQGRGPRTVARHIQQHIGLSPNQTRAVLNFRRELEAGDRNALSRALAKNRLTTAEGSVITRSGHAGGKGLGSRDMALLETRLGNTPLTADQIDRMTDAYRKRMEAWNAEAHSRTIALQAQKAGQRASWEDAIAKGVVSRSDLRRTWITVRDSRVRDEHQKMHGQVTTFDAPFSNGEMEPGESTYNCRCVARITMVRKPATQTLAGQITTPPLVGAPAPVAATPQATTPVAAAEELRLRVISDFESAHRMAVVESGVIVDARGVVVAEHIDGRDGYVGKSNIIRWTEQEAAKAKDATLTHNHPFFYEVLGPGHVRQANGGSFSMADIAFATDWDVAEMRAVDQFHRHRMIRPAGGWGDKNAILARAQVLRDQLESEFNNRYREFPGPGGTHRAWLHEVWSRVAREFGLDYRREAW